MEYQKISKVIESISDSMTRIDGERAYIKEAKAALRKEHEVPTVTINLMVKLYHNRMADEYFVQAEEDELLYENLFGKTEN